MTYRAPRSPKILAGGLVAIVVSAFLFRTNADAMKEAYFTRVLENCSSGRAEHMADWQEWPRSPAFDAEVRRFVASTSEEMAVIECVERWSGWLTLDIQEESSSVPGDYAALETAISGGQFAPPMRIFEISYIEFVEPADR